MASEKKEGGKRQVSHPKRQLSSDRPPADSGLKAPVSPQTNIRSELLPDDDGPVVSKNSMVQRFTASFKVVTSFKVAAKKEEKTSFEKANEEMKASPHYAELFGRDSDATFTESDYFLYKLENAIAANPAVRFYILLFISLVSCVVLAMLWVVVAGADDDHEETNDTWGALFMVFQVLITGLVHISSRDT